MKFNFLEKMRARINGNEIYDAETEALKTLGQVPAKDEIAKKMESEGNLSFYLRHTNKARYNMDYSAAEQKYPFGHKMNPETQMEEIGRMNKSYGIDESELDVKPEGILYAQSEARKFFARLKLLDSTGEGRKKPVNVYCSTELRAMVTARQYALVGEEMGFNVNIQEDTGTKIAGELGHGKVKSMDVLAIHTPKVLLFLFNNSSDGVPDTKHWDDMNIGGERAQMYADINGHIYEQNVDKWKEARAYVLERLKRPDEPWGEVFARLGKEVGDKFFPGQIQTIEKIHENQFLQVDKIIKENSEINSIDIYVSHEELVAGQLEIQGLPHTVKNCEPWLVSSEGIVRAN